MAIRTIPPIRSPSGATPRRQPNVTVPMYANTGGSNSSHNAKPKKTRPALGTLAIYSFLQTYNQYLWPLLVTNDQSMRTVQIGIALLQDQERFMFNIVMAGVVIILVPTFVLFVFGNRQLIRGLTAGAVKG